MKLAHTFGTRTAGLIVWLVLLLITTADSWQFELIHKVVFFAIWVVVPLALSLVSPEGPRQALLYRFAVLAQPLGALLTSASFLLEKGLVSAVLSSSWLIVNVLIALFGLARLVRRGLYPLAESSIDAGFLYLPVAGGWLVIYRLGIQPFDYGETIILLTVIHFHFAGFAAPIIAGMTGRVLGKGKYPRAVFGISVLGIVAAMPLVAAGITYAAMLGLIGTLLLSASLTLLALLTIGWVRPAIGSGWNGALLLIGALANFVAMVLACLYSYSLVSKTLILTIPAMAVSHGLLNAFGFVTCSLIAWSRILPPPLTKSS